VKLPVAFPPAVEAIPVPEPDDSSRADEAPIPVVNVFKSEASPKLGVAMDTNQTQGTEQSHLDMDVDEELLSLIADDLPSRSTQTTLRKKEHSLSETKHSSYHTPLKQESGLDTLPPSHTSPGPSSFTINSETVSTLSPDAAAFTRNSETSALKLEERPHKKKVNQLVLGYLLALLTFTRQSSMHSPKVAPDQAVRQRRSLRYHPMVPRQDYRKVKSYRPL
jgi:hypothetical protein